MVLGPWAPPANVEAHTKKTGGQVPAPLRIPLYPLLPYKSPTPLVSLTQELHEVHAFGPSLRGDNHGI